MPVDASIITPFSDAVTLVSFRGEEGISQTFSFQLELSSASSSLDFSRILGKQITIALLLPAGQSQYLNGVVTSFSQGAHSENGSTAYFAQIEPWFSLLRMNVNQRIFQNLSVPDIIEQIFSELGLTDYKNSLTATYSLREYCVQYGETTFDFISRLMESEGIFYFFTHTTSTHTLVLADDSSAFTALPGIDTIRYNQTGRSWETIDVMTEGKVEQNLVPVKVSADDFELPHTLYRFVFRLTGLRRRNFFQCAVSLSISWTLHRQKRRREIHRHPPEQLRDRATSASRAQHVPSLSRRL